MTKDTVDLINFAHNYNINPKTREIWLHGHYSSSDDDPGVDFRQATTFVKNLRLLDQINHKPILIHLQSPGGDWQHGLSMMDAIQFCCSSVTMLAYGEVSSMSALIFQAGKKRILMPNCEFMIHFGYVYVEGSTIAAKSMMEFEAKSDDEMIKVYTKKCMKGKNFKNKTENEVFQFLKNKLYQVQDWYMNAEEAVDYGFADGILGTKNYENIEKIC
jgi:ATP-dependent protease ClpP protease subunit